MMPHDDLKPGETVTLVSDRGTEVSALYTHGDTLRRFFVISGKTVPLAKRPDGSLAKAGKRWTIAGEPRHTRMVIPGELVGRH